MDGNNHQIDLITSEAGRRGVDLTVLVDFVHVLEYLWAAAWSFFAEGDPAAEGWVKDRALAVLDGRARSVAAGIRRRATAEGLANTKRKKADDAARYLTNKAGYLDYPTALAAGWPIATGVIEGTCRHLVKDRMDITGARWSVEGAEAVLKLRAVRCNGDMDTYWQFHLSEELPSAIPWSQPTPSIPFGRRARSRRLRRSLRTALEISTRNGRTTSTFIGDIPKPLGQVRAPRRGHRPRPIPEIQFPKGSRLLPTAHMLKYWAAAP